MSEQASGRRLVDRLLSSSLARRSLASFRRRSGIDRDLYELSRRLAHAEQSLDSVRHLMAPLPTRGTAKASMTPRDADLLEDVLLATAQRSAHAMRVCEWGRLIGDRGIGLLHDAQRAHYACALDAFRSGCRIGDELWIGARIETTFAEIVPPHGFAPGPGAAVS